MSEQEPDSADVVVALLRLLTLWCIILLVLSAAFWQCWNRSVSPVFGLTRLTHAESACGLVCLWITARLWRGVPISIEAKK